jgi:hypothetical protein
MSDISQEITVDISPSTRQLYRGKIIPLYEGHRQENKAFYDRTQAFSVKQAQMFLIRRYPFPKYLVEEPLPDRSGLKTMPAVTDAVIRTDPALDAMVAHLGYRSVPEGHAPR